ncbi:MAG: SDR family oxidoreductase [Pirellula sp.]|nr:SDR family oxidoreductase [Pirellula sp.]
MLPLLGQNALVTGAARGIGAGIAKALAAAGANVAVNDIREPSETVEACRATGRRAISAVVDVSDQKLVEAMVDRVENELGPISILVSNAAYSDRELFYLADMDGFEKTIAVCMWGPYYLARAIANRMISRSKPRDAGRPSTQGNSTQGNSTLGNMVFVSSPHAYKAIPGAMAYNMAKAALDQMARTAAVELSEYRIRVNLVHPGWTDTPGERKFFFDKELEERGSQLPWGRLATPDDISHGVVFLVHPQSDYITGATLSIDGGIVLPYQELFRIRDRP